MIKVLNVLTACHIVIREAFQFSRSSLPVYDILLDTFKYNLKLNVLGIY